MFSESVLLAACSRLYLNINFMLVFYSNINVMDTKVMYFHLFKNKNTYLMVLHELAKFKGSYIHPVWIQGFNINLRSVRDTKYFLKTTSST